MIDLARRHPALAAVVVLCTLGGAGGGVYLGPDTWTLPRRLLAGALAGLGVALIVLVNRMIGAYREAEIDVREDRRLE